jgi:hypothetical protein
VYNVIPLSSYVEHRDQKTFLLGSKASADAIVEALGGGENYSHVGHPVDINIGDLG